MSWATGNSSTIYGYSYSYNDYNWMTNAVYGEGSSISSNLNRYSEIFSSFHPNGGAQRIMRYGKMPSGTFSQVDNLTVTYSGNRISKVSDAAQPVTTTGSMDFPGGSTPKSFAYNSFGALVRDQSRGISNISYDNNGNPVKITYADGMTTTNVYSATGEKLKTVHGTLVSAQADAMSMMETAMDMYSDFNLSSDEDSESIETAESESETAIAEATDATGESTIEYRGPVLYKDGTIDMMLFPGGYATVSGGVTFHYYTQDYLGNNRAVINGTTGAIEQTISYYPYGGIIPELSTNSSAQPFKFGGKELITANGLNEYDFGARQYYQAVPHFTRIDPMCEKYPWLSPYLYCGNNPVNAYDSNGMEFTAASEGFVNRLEKEIEKRIMKNDMRISKLNDKLEKRIVNKKKTDKIENKIAKLNSKNEALKQISNEISILRNSSQVYNIVEDHSMNVASDQYGNGGAIFSSAQYDVDTGVFNISLGDNSLGMISHELKHAFQFESGTYSNGKYPDGKPFYDKTDEIDAYARSSMFGLRKPSNFFDVYKNIQDGSQGVDSLPEIIKSNNVELQKYANRSHSVFRWRGVTYNGLN